MWTGEPAGPWTRLDLPGGTTISTAEHLISTPAGPDVAGLLDQRFGLWALRDDEWMLTETFGNRDPGSTSASYVSGLADPGGLVAATYSDGVHFGLWVAGDVPMPTPVSVDGDRTASVAAHGTAPPADRRRPRLTRLADHRLTPSRHMPTRRRGDSGGS
jgi:hypothetical protein